MSAMWRGLFPTGLRAAIALVVKVTINAELIKNEMNGYVATLISCGSPFGIQLQRYNGSIFKVCKAAIIRSIYF